MRKTLIVIDMQNDFIDGVLGSDASAAIIPKVKEKIKKYISNGDEVIFTRDTHDNDDYLSTNEGIHLPIPHCNAGSYGWEVHKDLDIPECEHVNKFTFGYPDWELTVNDRGGWSERNFYEVEIVGLYLDICVLANAILIKTYFPDVEVTVDASCCAGTTPEAYDAALTIMKSCHINVV